MLTLYFSIGYVVLGFLLQVFIFYKSFRWINPKHKASDRSIVLAYIEMEAVLILVFLFFLLLVEFFSKGSSVFAACMVCLIFIPCWLYFIHFRFNLKWGKSLKVFLIYTALTLPVSGISKVFLHTYSIPSGSMEDTVMQGDYVLANEIIYGHSFFNKTPRFFKFRDPQKGDLVVFVYPQDKSKVFLKRCVGVPGDVVRMRDARLFVDGQE